MKLDELIRTRRTVHAYTTEKVNEAWVREALNLAVWAPNHKLTFPWRFVIVGSQARAAIGEISANIKAKKKGLSDIERQAVVKQFTQPSHLIIVSMKLHQDTEMQWEDYAAVAAGLQNAALYLWEKGVGTKWTTGGATKDSKTYELAGIEPQQERIVGFLWVGFAAKAPPVPERPSPDQFIREIP